MKTYYVETENVNKLKSALGRLIEYTDMLETETGRDNDSFLFHVLDEEDIDFSTEEV